MLFQSRLLPYGISAWGGICYTRLEKIPDCRKNVVTYSRIRLLHCYNVALLHCYAVTMLNC